MYPSPRPLPRSTTRSHIEPLERRTFLSSGWTTVDDFQLFPEAARNTGHYALAVDDAGTLYAGGMGIDAAGTRYLFLRERPAESISWNTTWVSPSPSGVIEDLEVDRAGNVYLAESRFDTTLVRQQEQKQFQRLPVLGVGHSLGGLLQVLHRVHRQLVHRRTRMTQSR